MNYDISIIGAGISGVGAAILAKTKGLNPFVSDFGTINDFHKQKLLKYDIAFEEKKHTESIILNTKKIVKSPGIEPKVDIIQKAKLENIPIISELEFTIPYTQAKLFGITGTNGKTTTANLTYSLLKEAGIDVALVGNVGISFAEQVALNQHKNYVIEISSFQLDHTFNMQLEAAVLLNITPDHLNRYRTMEKYIDSKFRIAQNQDPKQLFIYNQDDPNIIKNIGKYNINSTQVPISVNEPLKEGAWIEDQHINISIKSHQIEFKMEYSQLTISGKHNLYNSMAAAIVANSLSIRKESIRNSMSAFKSLEHRMEYVATVRGIEFINDSKATNVNAAWFALESAKDPIVWIAGGQDKGNDYSQLSDLVKSKVRIIVCLGLDNRRIHESFSKDVEMIVNTTTAEEAANVAFNLANKGDTVLLSPACASFDLFENYEERGRLFKKAVRAL